MRWLALSQEIEKRYRQYLQTTFYFRDRELRASFEEALRKQDLAKGPYLEATPVFRLGLRPRRLLPELLEEIPDEGFLRALLADRPLYAHQEQAIRLVTAGHNIVVATGTGSGKTEAFLYPILTSLYEEHRTGGLGPGVRALILYPMNALANDQRERLGEICRRLAEARSDFQFTFGQYTGDTPKNEHDNFRHAADRLHHRLPGELVLRSEMREKPPHILLTNFSMLEYLLLRPYDSPLFDNGMARWWQFFVLDEAHQYRGSRGTEMAVLLRRLKQRLRSGGRRGPFRCIATSATLMGEKRDKGAVAGFAANLFGEPFDQDAVILGEIQPIPEAGSFTLPAEIYGPLEDLIRNADPKALQQAIDALPQSLRPMIDGALEWISEPERLVGAILQRDRRSLRLRQEITGTPTEVAQLVNDLFPELPEQERPSAMEQLVGLLVRAKEPDSAAALLSARYHLFVRALEGAFISYYPDKAIFLDRQSGEEKQSFEVALCRECGQHYFVGQIRDGRFVEAIRDPANPQYGAVFLRPLEDSKATDETLGEEDEGERLRLCVMCGRLATDRPSCGHNAVIDVRKEPPPSNKDRADELNKCSACGYTAGGHDPVREVVYGAEGPHAVIATALHGQLPEGRRKVLAFADGRQQAAFFAWYLEKSYEDIKARNLLWRSARELAPYAGGGVSLKEVATALHHLLVEEKVLPPAMGSLEAKREAWVRTYREFLTDEPRISLAGVGLVKWLIAWPDWISIPSFLMEKPWSLSGAEAKDLLFLLLDSMRADRAVELRAEPGVDLHWDDLGLQVPQARFSIGRPRGRTSVRSWDAKKGKRCWFLTKILMNGGMTEAEAREEAVRCLRTIWEQLGEVEKSAGEHRLLSRMEDARCINPDWWRLLPLETGGTLFRCQVCSRLQSVSVRQACSRYGCPGSLEPVAADELAPIHYRRLYESDMPARLRVEEHTAQLEREKATEFQREFRDGKIHALSCSTTFELGVDLGDLDTIFLRNVPPEPFNYAQRVGRAGRRSGFPGFAVTYCRRSSHDLYHFAEPERMLAGRTRPPTLSLQNQKIILRHIMAVALSAFFRANPENEKRFQSVESFFGNLEEPTAVSDFRRFLDENQAALQDAIQAIIEHDALQKMGLGNRKWIAEISSEDSPLARAEAEVASDYCTVRQIEREAVEGGDYRRAGWAQKRAKTITTEDVLSFLSRKAVIPKYGFPVDVVELDTHRNKFERESMEVTLQRDLAIAVAEFAPTSRLIANKKEWESYGLKRVAEREWEQWWYARCPRHNHFARVKCKDEPRPPTFKRCCRGMRIGKYIDPVFGFITRAEKPAEPKRKPARLFTTRPYFAGFQAGGDTKTDLGPLSLTPVSPGIMVVLCEGRRGEGFYVCGRCGAGFRNKKRKHSTPFGKECGGTLIQASLGHEFVTDVLEVQFHPTPELGEGWQDGRTWFGFSLAYTILEGAAQILDIPATDLGVTVGYLSGEHPLPPIVLYDDVPGGAGLVGQLEAKEAISESLRAGLKRIMDCSCGEETSCYGCLRSYRNQFAHPHLRRGPVVRYLKTLLGQL